MARSRQPLGGAMARRRRRTRRVLFPVRHRSRSGVSAVACSGRHRRDRRRRRGRAGTLGGRVSRAVNVVILTNSALWGGLEPHALALMDTLTRLGHEPTLVCFGDRAYDLYRPRVGDASRLIDLGPPERRSVLGWWRALRTLDADAAVLEKGTLRMGSFSLD